MRGAPRRGRGVLRALSVLATSLWIGLASFTVIAVYFAAAGGVWACLSQPFFITDYDSGVLKLIIGVMVENQAIFDLLNVRAEGELLDGLGNVLCENSTGLYHVGIGGEVDFKLFLCLNVTELATNPATSYMMTRRAKLTVNMTLRMIYAYIFPTKAIITIPADWGPPLLGLRASLMPGPTPDTTCALVAFKNAATFWFKGYVNAYLYGDGELLAQGRAYTTVHKHESKNLSIVLPVDPDRLPERCKLVLAFDTNMFYFTWGVELG